MNILFRADGNAQIGAGHIMRCLSLAEALCDSGGTAAFLSADLAESFADRLSNTAALHALKSEPYGTQDAAETAALAKEIRAQWIVLDGYSFTPQYQQALKELNMNVLLLDDISHHGEYVVDIVLNQNPHADQSQYPHIGADTKLLLGTRFTMLQRAFRTAVQKEPASNVSNILITLGGSDPENITPKVVRALEGSTAQLTIVVGGANPHLNAIKQAIDESNVNAEIVVNATNMPELMQRADLAITAAGSTCYELAFMGVPMITIIVAKNQVGVATGLEANAAAYNLGWHTELSRDSIQNAVKSLEDVHEREKLIHAGKTLIDGLGAFRVLMEMSESPLYLREATSNDCKMIFEWANDPDTRSASFSSDTIPWEDHEKWFASKLEDEKSLFFIGMNGNDEPVGQVRFDYKSDTAMISVSVAPNMRGKKYSVPLISAGCLNIFGQTGCTQIDAFIKPENAASIAAFTKAGFKEAETTEYSGTPALRFALNK